jgi:hypothetical protein
MGGVNSGQKRIRNQGDVEDCLAIDMRVLKNSGMLRAGECVIDALRWSRGDKIVAQGKLRLDLEHINHAKITLSLSIANECIDQQIKLKPIRCNFGGWRYQLICPVNGTPHDVLYLSNGRFASRRAHALTYRSQNSTKLSRIIHRSIALQSRLDGRGKIRKVRGKNRQKALAKWHQLQSEKFDILAERIGQN